VNQLRWASAPVPAVLRPWIADIAVLSVGPSAQVLTRVPDSSTTLVFRTAPSSEDEVMVLGPRTAASYHRGDKDVSTAVRLRLHPGWGRAVLGLPIDEITDQIVSLRDLWGASGRQLASASSPVGGEPERFVARLGGVLHARLSTLSARDEAQARLAKAATDELNSATPTRRLLVGDIAYRLNISERQLRDIFSRTVGVSPKRFARIQRVRTVLSSVGHRPLARLAHEIGYYDQSHMTTEFRTTMGTTPRAFIAGQRPAPTGC